MAKKIMDTSQLQLSDHPLVNQVLVAVFVILLWKLLPSCFTLLMKAYQKLQTVGFRSPTPDELTHEDINDELIEEAKISSFDSVKCEYEVFLSFRGEDTRNNFVSHLYKELKTKGIHAFKDDKELKRGKSISPSLLEAIEKSAMAIVVLSPNYAFSSWCLDELVEIVECRKMKQQTILPIFYNVDPSDVDDQTGVIAKAFETHREKFTNDKIKKWRNALSVVATISGWDSRKCFDGNDATLIECIVRDVSDRLVSKSPSIKTRLVGIDSHIMGINEKLGLKCNDVRMVGIWGPSGIGKTTIAEFIYHRDFSKYEACCFLKNIKTKYEKNGAIALQKELIIQTLSEKNLDIWSEDVGCEVICRRLRSKRVLIVLDDINETQQLEVIANDVQWFGQGSRIIITTRDKRLLVQHGVEYIYEVPYLKKDKALQLFCLHAFKENQPPNEFLELSDKFISYTQGLPLALKILGGSLYKRDVGFWRGELEKVKKFPNEGIYRTMKISYDGLEENVKDVFLDIAFFFNGETRSKAETILHQCHFYPQNAFPILEEKALLTISNDKLEMHDLIKAMGHKIVKDEAKNPSERSRVCDPDDVYDVLMNCKKGSSIEGISLNLSSLEKSIEIQPKRFKRMLQLRILDFFVSDGETVPRINLPESLDYLSNKLRYFRWDYFPLESLPFASFGANLVELMLWGSNIRRLWDGEVELGNLRTMNLSFSNLEALPSLTKVPNVEEIRLVCCQKFHEFSSDLKHLDKLKRLDLMGCNVLDELPVLPLNLVELDLSRSSIKELPLGFHLLKKLKILKLEYCEALTTLVPEFGELESLSVLTMIGAAIEELPPSFVKLKSWKKLVLRNFEIKRLPENIGEMNSLTELSLENVAITELPESVGELQSLLHLNLERVPVIELPLSVGHLHTLKYLNLKECTRLLRLPSSMHELLSLQVLSIISCSSLDSLPELPLSLERLGVIGCQSLKSLPSIESWKRLLQLKEANILGCNELDPSEIWEYARVKIHDFGPKAYNPTTHITGNEVPDWFDHKSDGSSIIVKLPSVRQGTLDLGFCAVFECMRFSWSYSVCAKCDLLHLESSKPVYMYRLGVDHVLVWGQRFHGVESELLASNLGCEVRFNFPDEYSTVGEEKLKVKVKKCGVHAISNREPLPSLSLIGCSQLEQEIH